MMQRSITKNGVLTRRGFLDWFTRGGVLAFLVSIFYPVVRYLVPPEAREANVSQVKVPFTRADIATEPRMAKTFKFGRSLGIIVLTRTGQLKALAATCTHLDCTVQHRPDLELIWCSCHNGRYDLNGKNISGPPPKPLEQFVVNEVGEDIFVSRGSS